MNFLKLATIGFLISAQSVFAQNNVAEFKSVKRDANEFTFTNTNGAVKIQFCTPRVFRLRYSWDGNFEANEPYMVSKYQWDAIKLNQSDSNNEILINSDSLKLVISKSPFSIKVYNKAGILINEDALPAQKTKSEVTINKKMQAEEHFFGFGERMDFLDRKGKQLKLNVGRGGGLPHYIGAYNILEANYCPVTFFMSTKGYGIYLHNSFASNWDMGHSDPNKYSFSAVDGELDYYFMYGPDFPTLINEYTDVTGKSPLMPKFALGLHVGTYSGGTWGHEEMTSTQYVVALAAKLRAQNIPADLIWLDSTWRLFGENGGKGATTFEWRETFKDPKSMFDSIYAMNY